MKKNTLLRYAIVFATLGLALTGCDQGTPQQHSTANDGKTVEALSPPHIEAQNNDLSPSESIELAAMQLDEAGFMQHVNILASDEFEGRAPSTPGGRKTVDYLEDNFKSLGLAPLFTGKDGKKSYRQAVNLMELTVTNDPPLVLKHADGSTDNLIYKRDSVSFTSRTGDRSAIDNSELVFVGYGVVAPEYDWNDYAGLDMSGKTAVILVNDPGYRVPDGDRFKGRAMTYYGRWTYKYEEAARQGAAGAIVIHENGAAGYPWQVVGGSWSGPQYKLFTEDGNAGNVAVEAWITQTAAENLFAKNGLDYREMVAHATRPGFKPIPMTSTASSSLALTSRASVSYNVGALIPGRARADEAFIYTAHWDHLGIKPNHHAKDKIFNGAQDNATGTAALLEMAQAFKALPSAPERSVVFLAVTAEESGLLGSKQYAESPAFAMSKTVAGVNIDAMSTIGESDDVVVVGYGNSQMDDYLVDVATTQNREVVPEPTPEKGFFYRSDHFNLAKKGVPMLYAKAGQKIRNKPAHYGARETAAYLAQRYHEAADEVHATWDNGGVLQDMNAYFRIGAKISNSDAWPQWSDGNEFKAIRDASLAE